MEKEIVIYAEKQYAVDWIYDHYKPLLDEIGEKTKIITLVHEVKKV